MPCPLCRYHRQYGGNAFRCEGSLRMFRKNISAPNSRSQGTAKTAPKCDHRLDNQDPLIFFTDRRAGVKFLVDTGAACSLFPAEYD